MDVTCPNDQRYWEQEGPIQTRVSYKTKLTFSRIPTRNCTPGGTCFQAGFFLSLFLYPED
jgi:hypothetical protein